MNYKKLSALFRCANLALIIFALTGCDESTEITTSGGGHAIVARIEGSHSIDNKDAAALIASEFGTVRILADRVQIDNAQWTKIPENVAVELKITRRKVSISAGPVSIQRTRS